MYRLTRISNETAERKTGLARPSLPSVSKTVPGTFQFARSLGNQAVRRWVDQGFTMNSGGPIQRQEPPGLSGETEEEGADQATKSGSEPSTSGSEGVSSQPTAVPPVNSGSSGAEQSPNLTDTGPPLPAVPNGSQQAPSNAEPSSPGALHEGIHSENQTPSEEQQTPGFMDVLREGMEETDEP